jgi:uncharacterized membrane protein
MELFVVLAILVLIATLAASRVGSEPPQLVYVPVEPMQPRSVGCFPLLFLAGLGLVTLLLLSAGG